MFPAQSRDSLSTVCCDGPFLFEGKKNLKLKAFRCSQRYSSTPDRKIAEVNFRRLWHHMNNVEHGFD